MIKNINHITLAITDIEKSFIFYRDIVGLTPLVKWDKGAYFLAGQDWFCLNQDNNYTINESYTHYAFSVDIKNFDVISAKIINSGACIFKDNTSPEDSLYFLDPDGHKLEIHVGTYNSRIKEKKLNPGSWKNIVWFV